MFSLSSDKSIIWVVLIWKILFQSIRCEDLMTSNVFKAKWQIIEKTCSKVQLWYQTIHDHLAT